MPQDVETDVYLSDVSELEFLVLPNALVEVYLVSEAELESLLS